MTAMEETVWAPPELWVIGGSALSYEGAADIASAAVLNNGVVTHFYTDVPREGEEYFIRHLMNSNPLLHTVEWRMVQFTNELRGVESNKLRRLTLWSCGFAVSDLDALVRTAGNLTEFVLGGRYTTVTREEVEEATPIDWPHLKRLHVNIVDIRYEGEYHKRSTAGRCVGNWLVECSQHLTVDKLEIKAYTTDTDVVSCLIDQTSMTLKRVDFVLIADRGYMPVPDLDFQAAPELEEVSIMCEQKVLCSVVQWLKTADSDRLSAIDVFIIVRDQKVTIDALTQLDREFEARPWNTFEKFNLHTVPTHTFAATQRTGSLPAFKEEVYYLGALAMPYLHSRKKYFLHWGKTGKGGLNERFVLKPRFVCANEAGVETPVEV